LLPEYLNDSNSLSQVESIKVAKYTNYFYLLQTVNLLHNPFSNLFSQSWPPQLFTNLFYREKTAWLLCCAAYLFALALWRTSAHALGTVAAVCSDEQRLCAE
jgi:hypothetical protein